jgi:hypothetical protein
MKGWGKEQVYSIKRWRQQQSLPQPYEMAIYVNQTTQSRHLVLAEVCHDDIPSWHT